jgi:hypothetical protein
MIADKCVTVRPASEDKGESGALWTRTFATAMDELCAQAGVQRSGCVSAAHRGDGKRFVVRADEKLTAFAELESQLAVKGMAF